VGRVKESDFITRLRSIATHPAARGLLDDAAVLGDLVMTHDMIVEGVHYLADDAPADVAWKLMAVNLSDLAAKGATPMGVLMGYGLSGDPEWDREFVEELGQVLRHFDVPLLGGDTVRLPLHAPRCFGLTAIGRAPEGGAPRRSGAKPGDHLWVTGSIGDAGIGLATRRDGANGLESHCAAYARPQPQLAFGQAVAPLVHAMMDVSDGLLIDASRMASASQCRFDLAIEAVPLSPATLRVQRDVLATRMVAVTAGDDYQLLFAADPAEEQAILQIGERLDLAVCLIGSVHDGAGLALTYCDEKVSLPDRLGFTH
jgi:thiamine-monophosphate kinase